MAVGNRGPTLDLLQKAVDERYSQVIFLNFGQRNHREPNLGWNRLVRRVPEKDSQSCVRPQVESTAFREALSCSNV
jgi:hypothetical protein